MFSVLMQSFYLFLSGRKTNVFGFLRDIYVVFPLGIVFVNKK